MQTTEKNEGKQSDFKKAPSKRAEGVLRQTHSSVMNSCAGTKQCRTKAGTLLHLLKEPGQGFTLFFLWTQHQRGLGFLFQFPGFFF